MLAPAVENPRKGASVPPVAVALGVTTTVLLAMSAVTGWIIGRSSTDPRPPTQLETLELGVTIAAAIALVLVAGVAIAQLQLHDVDAELITTVAASGGVLAAIGRAVGAERRR